MRKWVVLGFDQLLFCKDIPMINRHASTK